MKKMLRPFAAMLVAIFVAAVYCAPVAAQDGSAPKITDLAWLVGDWRTAAGGRRQVDEHWTVPAGGVMMGVSRTVSGGKMSEFEFLRIVERADGIFYIAQPNGRAPGTEFKLTKVSAEQATFENPQHDFPKRIMYKKTPDGITASIDAGEGTKGPSFVFKSMAR